MKAQFNQLLDVSLLLVFWVKFLFDLIDSIVFFFVNQEQVTKIRSYEARVNKAKKNYTKALERLEELNQKIYEEQKSEFQHPPKQLLEEK